MQTGTTSILRLRRNQQQRVALVDDSPARYVLDRGNERRRIVHLESAAERLLPPVGVAEAQWLGRIPVVLTDRALERQALEMPFPIAIALDSVD